MSLFDASPNVCKHIRSDVFQQSVSASHKNNNFQLYINWQTLSKPLQ